MRTHPGMAACLAVAILQGGVRLASAQERPAPPAKRQIELSVGKSLVMDSPVNIQRVSVGDAEIAEAVTVSPKEILLNSKSPGETTLILWQEGGKRLLFDLAVQPGAGPLQAVQRQIRQELRDEPITVELEGDHIFLRGTASDLSVAARAEKIAAAFGKPVNLLRVVVPPPETQVLLKVRFANIDRAASTELGVNIMSTGALNTVGRISTGQFSPPAVEKATPQETKFTFSDALNVFLFRPDIDLAATIRALQNRRLLEILAEPNVLALNGRPASFLAGGEFPYPTLQGGGGGLGAVTIQFREFGVRLNFVPRVTPRGTIRLLVTPEVSSLDFANGLVFQGFTIPALSTRRVETEIELNDRQSFALGGLLDNRVTENLMKIPGLGDIPLLGKLFRSRSLARSNSELLVLVTPELVRPIPAGQPVPEVKFPVEFMKEAAQAAPRTPGLEATGPVPVKPPQQTVPIEQLIESQKPLGGQPAGTAPQIQFVPVPMTAQPAAAAPPAPGAER